MIPARKKKRENALQLGKQGMKAPEIAKKALDEIQQYRKIGTAEEIKETWKSGYNVGYTKGYDDGYALGVTQPI